MSQFTMTVKKNGYIIGMINNFNLLLRGSH